MHMYAHVTVYTRQAEGNFVSGLITIWASCDNFVPATRLCTYSKGTLEFSTASIYRRQVLSS